jgi:hypothetical protein
LPDLRGLLRLQTKETEAYGLNSDLRSVRAGPWIFWEGRGAWGSCYQDRVQVSGNWSPGLRTQSLEPGPGDPLGCSNVTDRTPQFHFDIREPV